jgi:hypothetical protein
VAFFYCRHKDSDRSTFLSVSRGLLSQFLSYDNDLLAYLYEKASSSGHSTLSTDVLARELLGVCIKNFEKLYVIIDGLDECERDERKQIITFLEDTWTSLPPKDVDSLRCLFLSQDDNVARKDHANMSSFKMNETHTKQDINAYCAVRSVEIGAKFHLSTDQQYDVQNILVTKAEGKNCMMRGSLCY